MEITTFTANYCRVYTKLMNACFTCTCLIFKNDEVFCSRLFASVCISVYDRDHMNTAINNKTVD